MDGGGGEGVVEGPPRDSACFGWNVTVALSATDGDASPVSGTSRALVVPGLGGPFGSGAEASSVGSNGSSAFGGIDYRPRRSRKMGHPSAVMQSIRAEDIDAILM